MEKMTNWEELKWRGLVKDVAGDDIADKINNEKMTNITEILRKNIDILTICAILVTMGLWIA